MAVLIAIDAGAAPTAIEVGTRAEEREGCTEKLTAAIEPLAEPSVLFVAVMGYSPGPPLTLPAGTAITTCRSEANVGAAIACPLI